MRTFVQKEQNVHRSWLLVDAKNKTLGRLATVIARHLNGKNKPEYTPWVDVGDYVIVINAEKVHTTGSKLKNKKYYHYSGYQGGVKEFTLEQLLSKTPTRVIKSAVFGMLPKGPLGRKMLRKLKIYSGAQHPHTGQQAILI